MKKFLIQKLKKEESGVTLVELVVATSAFSILVVGVIGVFLTALGGTRHVNDQQNILDSGRFVMEYMAKEIRMSEILNANEIVVGMGASCDINDSCLYARNSSDEEILIILDNSSKQISRWVKKTDGSVTRNYITPEEIQVTSLNFWAKKEIGNQPRATISITLESKDGQVRLNLQNTVSSREYDSEATR